MRGWKSLPSYCIAGNQTGSSNFNLHTYIHTYIIIYPQQSLILYSSYHAQNHCDNFEYHLYSQLSHHHLDYAMMIFQTANNPPWLVIAMTVEELCNGHPKTKLHHMGSHSHRQPRHHVGFHWIRHLQIRFCCLRHPFKEIPLQLPHSVPRRSWPFKITQSGRAWLHLARKVARASAHSHRQSRPFAALRRALPPLLRLPFFPSNWWLQKTRRVCRGRR